MPFAPGLLQVFKLRGETAGRRGGFGRGLGQIAGKLGALADVMELRNVARGTRGAGGVLGIPLADEGGEARRGHRERLSRLKRVQQAVEDSGEVTLVFFEDMEELTRVLIALLLQGAAEFGCLLADLGGGMRAAIPAGGFVANEVALDIEVTDLAGGLAKTFEQVQRLALLLLVRRQAGQRGEQGKLGFDPASRRAQAMDGFDARVGLAGPDCTLQRFCQLAKSLDRVRCVACWGHGR